MPVMQPIDPPKDDRAISIAVTYTAPGPVKGLDNALIRGLERVGYTLSSSDYLFTEQMRYMTFVRTPPRPHIPHAVDPSTPPPQPKVA